jgi:drug/metabolite transporter (DMT)-like permease
MVPVAMALITATVTRSWPPRPVMLCLPFVVAGLLLMALGGVGLDGAAPGQTLLGDAIFVLAGSSWALFTYLGQRWRVTPVQVTAVIAVLSCLVLPVQFTLLPSRLATAPWEMIAFHGLYQGLLVLVVGLLVWAHGVRVLGTEVTSRFSSLVPVAGFALAIPIAGEWPAPLQWLGMLSIVGGLLGLSMLRRR